MLLLLLEINAKPPKNSISAKNKVYKNHVVPRGLFRRIKLSLNIVIISIIVPINDKWNFIPIIRPLIIDETIAPTQYGNIKSSCIFLHYF